MKIQKDNMDTNKAQNIRSEQKFIAFFKVNFKNNIYILYIYLVSPINAT